MPEVKKGESEKDYVKRCIPYVMKEEGLNETQAAGKCYGMYRSHSNKINVIKYNSKTIKYNDAALLNWLEDCYKNATRHTVDGYLSPAPGDISEEESRELAKVYAEARKQGNDKKTSAKIAWDAVNG